MKKILLIILLVSIASLFAHEVTSNLTVVNDGARGLEFVRGDLWWGDCNYLVDLNFYYTDGQPIDFYLSQAWKKVDLWEYADFTIGRQTYSFGKLRSGRGSKNLQIQPLHVAPVNWMFKLQKGFGKFNVDADIAWPFIDHAVAGTRATYKTEFFTIGGSAQLGNVLSFLKGDDDNYGAYEFDIDFTLANFVNILAQFTRPLIGDEDNYYFIASYAKAFESPYLGKRLGRVIYGEWKPYLGMVTRNDADGDGMGENNIFLGFNFESFENSYMKFELNMDSDEDVDPTFLVQLGYKF